MRVLLVADVVGGVRTFVQELVRCSDVEFHLALLGREAIAAPGAVSCERRDLRLEWMEEPWEDLRRTAGWIEELALAHSPDLIHMNTFAPVLDPHVPVLRRLRRACAGARGAQRPRRAERSCRDGARAPRGDRRPTVG